MTNANGSDFTMRDLLLGFAEVINSQKGDLPMGCISKAGDGSFNARSITDVNNLADTVNAPDGFIKDGLMVRFAGQRKGLLTDKFRGYKVTFELNGIYNGVYVAFTKTEMGYKMYLNKEMWKVEVHEVEYSPIVEDGEGFKRNYKIPMVLEDADTKEYRCTDSRNTLENKVGLAMKSKLGADYNAFLGDKMFNEQSGKFELVEETVEAI